MEYNEQKYFESEIEDALEQLESDRLKERYAKMINSEPAVEKPGFFGQYGKIILAILVFILVLFLAGINLFSGNKLEKKSHQMMASLDVYQNPSWSMRSESSTASNVFSKYLLQLKNQEFAEAIATASTIGPEDRDMHLELSLAQAHLKVQNFEKALIACNTILNHSSFGLQEAEFTKALALLNLNQVDEAKELMNKIINNKQYKWQHIEQLLRLL